MSQHAPGPWTWDSDEDLVCDSRGNGIAEVYSFSKDGKLIAAAPELLEAVKGFMRWLDSDISLQEAKDMARAAIAKAEGKP